jgi:hypothetical protein
MKFLHEFPVRYWKHDECHPCRFCHSLTWITQWEKREWYLAEEVAKESVFDFECPNATPITSDMATVMHTCKE